MSLSLVKILLVLISLQVTDCKWTIDHYGIDLIVDAAQNGASLPDENGTLATRTPADGVTQWDTDVGAGEPWIWKKWEIVDRFEEGLEMAPLYSNIHRKAA